MLDLLDTLYTIKRNQVTMLLDRGYAVPDAFVLSEDRDTFRARVASDPPAALSAVLTDPPLWVLYGPTALTFGADEARTLRERADAADVPLTARLLLITPKPITKDAYLRLKDDGWSKDRDTLETFTYAQLVADPTRHFLAQPHRALSRTEAREFYRASGIAPRSMPQLHDSDPVARWYHFRPGQVVEIRRAPLIALAAPVGVFYRTVVAGPVSDFASKAEPAN